MIEAADQPNIPRGVSVTLVLFIAISLGLGWIVGQDLPELHGILDSAMFVVSGVLALLLWDMGERLDRPFKKHLALTFAVVALLEFVHTMVSVEWSGPLAGIGRIGDLRPLTWPPPAFALPLGIGASLFLLQRNMRNVVAFAVLFPLAALALFAVFQRVAPYSPPWLFAITRPSLVLVPVLWAVVLWACWKMREKDRAIPTLGLSAAAIFIASVIMLYSRIPADAPAVIAHLGRIAGYLALLFSLMHMASLDMVERIRSEAKLARANDELEQRVSERTVELQSEIGERTRAETKIRAQLERLALLHQISRAIGERQDLASVFQVAVRSVEQQLPADFACLCLYERGENALNVSCVGAESAPLALSLAMPERARIEIDANGLSRCVAGHLVYEPDTSPSTFPFPQRLARGGLRSFVAAPLQVESRVFGAFIVARAAPDAFESGECEFLRQLSEHVALAAHQMQLSDALQQAYDDLRLTQDAVMQQERLRALGQMASGIAHDINNALSPIALYTESLLETEPSLTPAGRSKLETVQRAIDDAAHTVSRMKEFYRRRETQLTLSPAPIEPLFQQVLDLTQARWRDMPQQRGELIEVKTEIAPDTPPVLGVESELREALINLVFNAIDALPGGGTITLRARRAPLQNGAASTLVQIDVVDNGVGMDEATRLRCLEPFFTTKGEAGTGLGLAMVYATVQRHGGDIDIESAPEKGTLMRMTLNAAPADATMKADAAPIAAIPSRLRLLIIDDDPILLRTLRDVLETDGHVVTSAADGAAGIAVFQQAHTSERSFDAVITDLGMPRIDGRRVAEAIKVSSPSTPVLLLTGWGERLKSEEENPPHVDCVLSKPPKLRDLRLALAQSLEARPQARSA
ncbi:MAG: ATP-binding protein [Vitreimonas sp.]